MSWPEVARLTYAGDYLHISQVVGDDAVFKALADPTPRALLDRLRERNGQTLGELCEPLAMARQSATQHLGVLAAANLISTVRRGREKLHNLNAVPLWAIAERWIEQFERPRLRALSAIKQRAEEEIMAGRPSYVYVTYIQSSPERVWEALTEPDLTAQYWGMAFLRLAGRLAVGAPAHRRLGHPRRGRHGAGVGDNAAAHHDVRLPRPRRGGRPVEGDLRHRAPR